MKSLKKRGQDYSHMNWNKIYFKNLKDMPTLKLFDKKEFYFVHSFYCRIKKKENLLTYTNHENLNFVHLYNIKIF